MHPVFKSLSNLLLLALLSILGACTLVPGTHINGSGLFGQSDLEGQALVVPITPLLISQMQSSQISESAKTNQELQTLSDQYSYRVGEIGRAHV